MLWGASLLQFSTDFRAALQPFISTALPLLLAPAVCLLSGGVVLNYATRRSEHVVSIERGAAALSLAWLLRTFIAVVIQLVDDVFALGIFPVLTEILPKLAMVWGCLQVYIGLKYSSKWPLQIPPKKSGLLAGAFLIVALVP